MGLDVALIIGPIGRKSSQEEADRLYGVPDAPKIVGVYNMDCFRDRADGVEEGYYEVAGRERVISLSYGGYNRWRSELAELIGTTDEVVFKSSDKTIPFYELINFADNEGFIGPKTSAKLAKDFADWQDRAGKRGHFAETFIEFRKAFERAAATQGGIKFH